MEMWIRKRLLDSEKENVMAIQKIEFILKRMGRVLHFIHENESIYKIEDIICAAQSY